MKEYKKTTPEIRLQKIKSDFKAVKITNSDDAVNYARQFYESDIEIYESMFIILMNRSYNTIGWAKISQGGVAGTTIDNKIIAKYAIETLCSGLILVHNHPSGNMSPSTSDVAITDKVKNSLKLFDIALLDHVIISVDNSYSFADNDRL
jgi:DNA repair protein RadC